MQNIESHDAIFESTLASENIRCFQKKKVLSSVKMNFEMKYYLTNTPYIFDI